MTSAEQTRQAIKATGGTLLNQGNPKWIVFGMVDMFDTDTVNDSLVSPLGKGYWIEQYSTPTGKTQRGKFVARCR